MLTKNFFGRQCLNGVTDRRGSAMAVDVGNRRIAPRRTGESRHGELHAPDGAFAVPADMSTVLAAVKPEYRTTFVLRR